MLGGNGQETQNPATHVAGFFHAGPAGCAEQVSSLFRALHRM